MLRKIICSAVLGAGYIGLLTVVLVLAYITPAMQIRYPEVSLKGFAELCLAIVLLSSTLNVGMMYEIWRPRASS
jgi:hypothetical protein